MTILKRSQSFGLHPHSIPSLESNIKLPDVLWPEIYQFLAGDPAVNGMPSIALAAREISRLSQVSYRLRQVVANAFQHSVYKMFDPLLTHVKKCYSETQYNRCREQLEGVTGVTWKGVFEHRLLRVSCGDPVTQRQGEVALRSIYALSLPDAPSICASREVLWSECIGDISSRSRYTKYQGHLFFLSILFSTLMNEHSRNIFVAGLMGDNKQNIEEVVENFLTIDESTPILERLFLSEGLDYHLTNDSFEVDGKKRTLFDRMLTQFLKTERGREIVLNARNRENITIAHLAAKLECFNILMYLLDESPEWKPLLVAADNHGCNISHYLVSVGEFKDIVSLFKQEQLRDLFFKTDRYGRNVVYYAIARSGFPFTLLTWMHSHRELGPLFTATRQDGTHVLHDLIMNKKDERMSGLMAFKSIKQLMLKVDERGFNIAHYAAAHGSCRTLEAMFENPETRPLLDAISTQDKQTIAHYGIPQIEVVEWLFSEASLHGLFTVENTEGQTPFDIAFQYGYDKVLGLARLQPADSVIGQAYAASAIGHAYATAGHEPI